MKATQTPIIEGVSVSQLLSSNGELLKYLHENRNTKEVKKFMRELKALSKADKPEKPKRVLTDEQLTKMKEGRKKKLQEKKDASPSTTSNSD